MKKVILAEEIFIIESFMTQKECNDLIIYSEQKGFEVLDGVKIRLADRHYV